MPRRFRLATFLLLLLSTLKLAAQEEPIVNLYTWADYVAPSVIEAFEAEHGIRVVYDTYDSDYVVPGKLLAGKTGYDLVGMAGVEVQRLWPLGVFQALDYTKLPNFENMNPLIVEIARFSDPNNRFGFIYNFGGTGIAYNVKMIRERMPDAPLDSASMVFDPDIVSRFADCGVSFLDDGHTMIRLSLRYLGHDIDSLDDAHWAEVEALLKAVRPFVRYYSSTRVSIDLPAGETCLAVTWNGDLGFAKQYVEEAGNDVELEFYVPREGSNNFIDMFLIPADASHSQNAHKLLDFLMRGDMAADVARYNRYDPANVKIWPYLDDKTRSDTSLFIPEQQIQRLATRTVWDMKQQRKAGRLWARVKGGL